MASVVELKFLDEISFIVNADVQLGLPLNLSDYIAVTQRFEQKMERKLES